MQDRLITSYKKKIVSYLADRRLNWDNRVDSRGESLYGTFKKDLVYLIGDLKNVINKFVFTLRRIYRKITRDKDADRIKVIPRFHISLLSRVGDKVTSYCLIKVLQQIKRLKPKAGETSVNLLPCTKLFTAANGLPCAHTIQPMDYLALIQYSNEREMARALGPRTSMRISFLINRERFNTHLLTALSLFRTLKSLYRRVVV